MVPFAGAVCRGPLAGPGGTGSRLGASGTGLRENLFHFGSDWQRLFRGVLG